MMSGRLRTLLLGEEFEGLTKILQLGESAVPKLIETLREEKDPVVRRRAAIALGQLRARKAVRPLLALLKDEDPVFRYTAADALGEIGSRSAVEPLSEHLGDADASVRRSILGALGKLRDKKSLERLKRVVKEEKIDFVKKKAEEALRAVEEA